MKILFLVLVCSVLAGVAFGQTVIFSETWENGTAGAIPTSGTDLIGDNTWENTSFASQNMEIAEPTGDLAALGKALTATTLGSANSERSKFTAPLGTILDPTTPVTISYDLYNTAENQDGQAFVQIYLGSAQGDETGFNTLVDRIWNPTNGRRGQVAAGGTRVGMSIPPADPEPPANTIYHALFTFQQTSATTTTVHYEITAEGTDDIVPAGTLDIGAVPAGALSTITIDYGRRCLTGIDNIQVFASEVPAAVADWRLF